MANDRAGALVIIGGAEDHEGECVVLRKFLALAGEKEARIAVVAAAARDPHSTNQEYEQVFARLGVRELEFLALTDRMAANSRAAAQRLLWASGVFLTGGDQLRMTSIMGGTLAHEALQEAHARGTVVAGTSAGASAIPAVMIVGGQGEEPPRLAIVSMAPGLGLVAGLVVDQHFAQRGRIGRLLAAVAQNPAVTGLGVDEDSAAVLYPDGELEAVGSGTVTVVDGRSITQATPSEAAISEPLSIHGVTLHVIAPGSKFKLAAAIRPGGRASS